MRERIFQIIEVAQENDIWSRVYDTFMMIIIIISIIPLAFKEQTILFNRLDKITVAIFIIDYILRLMTADYKIQKGSISFLIYPFTFMAIIDLISILPSVSLLSKGFRLLKIFRLFRTFRVFRVFKAFRYSKNIKVILNVVRVRLKRPA